MPPSLLPEHLPGEDEEANSGKRRKKSGEMDTTQRPQQKQQKQQKQHQLAENPKVKNIDGHNHRKKEVHSSAFKSTNPMQPHIPQAPLAESPSIRREHFTQSQSQSAASTRSLPPPTAPRGPRPSHVYTKGSGGGNSHRIGPTGPQRQQHSSSSGHRTNRNNNGGYTTHATKTPIPVGTPRERPTKWNVLCKNTVPDDIPYPPPNSHLTKPEMCIRRETCHYGHHGDRYLDGHQTTGLEFNHKGRAVERPSQEACVSILQRSAARRVQKVVGGVTSNGENSQMGNQQQLQQQLQPQQQNEQTWGPLWMDKRQQWRSKEASSLGYMVPENNDSRILASGGNSFPMNAQIGLNVAAAVPHRLMDNSQPFFQGSVNADNKGTYAGKDAGGGWDFYTQQTRPASLPPRPPPQAPTETPQSLHTPPPQAPPTQAILSDGYLPNVDPPGHFHRYYQSTTNCDENQKPTAPSPEQFELCLRRLSLDLRGGIVSSNDNENARGNMANTRISGDEGTAMKAEEEGEEIEEDGSDMTSSESLEFIVPACPKGPRIGYSHLRINGNDSNRSTDEKDSILSRSSHTIRPNKDHDSQSVASTGFAFDPSAAAFIPSCSSKTDSKPLHSHPPPPASVNMRQHVHKPSSNFDTKILGTHIGFQNPTIASSTTTQASQIFQNRDSIHHDDSLRSRCGSSHGSTWSQYRGGNSYHHREEQSGPSTEPTTPIGPSQLTWSSIYHKIQNPEKGDVPLPDELDLQLQRIASAQSGPYFLQNVYPPVCVSNTLIIQATQTSMPNKKKSNVGQSPLASEAKITVLDRINAIISQDSGFGEKMHSITLLKSLVAAASDAQENGSNEVAPLNALSDLEEAFQQMAGTTDPFAKVIVEGFRTEMWSVLSWLTGAGTNVGILEAKESIIQGRIGNVTISRGPSDDEIQNKPQVELVAGQIILDPRNASDGSFNELVGLIAGEPAILSPGKGFTVAPTNESVPVLLMNSAPLLGAGFPQHPVIPNRADVPQPVSHPRFLPIPLSRMNQSTNPASEAVQLDAKIIDFFLGVSMDKYLTLSYDKAVKIQTAISLKWKSIRKTFEKEWISELSKTARGAIVAKAILKVFQMEEEEVLYSGNMTQMHLHFMNNSTPEAKTENKWPLKSAVWDRRGLCLEAEPVALSENGNYFCRLVEKMCIDQVMTYEKTPDQKIGSGLKLEPPRPPELPMFGEILYRSHKPPKRQKRDEAFEQKVSDILESLKISKSKKSKGKETATEPTARQSMFQESIPRHSEDTTAIKNHGSDITSKDKSSTPDEPLDPVNDEYIKNLVEELKLQPKLIYNAAVDPVFQKLGPIYHSNDKGVFAKKYRVSDELRMRSILIEMCQLDRMVFLGRLVLEMFSAWEEGRKEAVKLKWAFPYAETAQGHRKYLRDCTVASARRYDAILEAQRKKEEKATQASAPVTPTTPITWAEVAKQPKPAAIMITPSPQTQEKFVVKLQVPVTPTRKTSKQEIQTKREEEGTAVRETPTKEMQKTDPPPTLPQQLQTPTKRTYAMVINPAAVAFIPSNTPAAGVVASPPNTKSLKGRKGKKKHNHHLGDDALDKKADITRAPDTEAPPLPVEPSGQQHQAGNENQKEGTVSAEKGIDSDPEFSMLSGSREEKAEKVKSNVLHKFDSFGGINMEMEAEKVRRWIADLQNWIHETGEAVGFEFIEVKSPFSSPPAENTITAERPPRQQMTDSVEGTLTTDGIPPSPPQLWKKRKSHRAGKKNAPLLRGNTKEEYEREQAAFDALRVHAVESAMREVRIAFMMKGALECVDDEEEVEEKAAAQEES